MNKIEPRRRFSTGVALACWLLVVGCRSDDTQVIDNKLVPLSLTENLQISTEHEDVLIGNFSGLAISSDGTIYAADGQRQQIHYFSSEGAYRGSIGEEGSGPGEFLGLDARLRILSDTLYVRDRSAGRITFFDLNTNQLSGSFNLPNSSIDDIPLGQPRDMFPMPGGNVLVSFVNPYFEAPNEGEKPHMVTFSLLDKTGEFTEKKLFQIPVLYPINQTLPLLSSGSINVVAGLSFYPDTRISADQEGNLFIANSDSLLIRLYSEHGRNVAKLTATPPMTELTESHLDSIADARDSPVYRRLLDDVIRVAGRPDYWPAFDYFLIDDSGRFWVKLLHPGKSEQTWWVFDPEGKLMWDFQLSIDVDLHQIKGDHVYGLSQSGGGLATIIRYRIEH
ncbi:MAG: 6-bladed beta-propeller [Balneolaceae bacterium]